MKEINIPNSVTDIYNHAFFDCPNLTNVTIGNSVKDIGDSTFDHCPNLENVTIAYAPLVALSSSGVEVAGKTEKSGSMVSGRKKERPYFLI